VTRAEARDRSASVLTVIGPTAVGKTAVALQVALTLGCEIVSADSRQIYRGMDIGTAKPSPAERALVRHHVIDVVEPRETYDASRYATDAERAIADIRSRGTCAIVVGGTGFYLSSLFEGLFEGPGRDERLRSELNRRAAEEGARALHAELAAVDPDAASRIHENDGSRIVRALEVYLLSGRTLSDWHTEARRTPAFRPFYVGLRRERSSLYEMIDRRVDEMMERGLLDEVRALVASGRLSAGVPGASAVGYRELLPVVEGAADDLGAAVSLIKRNTRRYAKRQMTWFSSVQAIHWLDADAVGAAAAADHVIREWRDEAGGSSAL
jgi:tRNA dimethylallyltransferase